MTTTLIAVLMLTFLNGCASDHLARTKDDPKRAHGTVSPMQKPLFEGEEHTGTNTTENRISPPMA